MRILLDTHILLWWLTDDSRLPTDIGDAVDNGSNDVVVSSISVAEISIKSALGKLQEPDDLLAQLRAASMISLPFTADHAIALKSLPWHHRDPFDRMLIVQALAESLVFATVDPACRQYAVNTLG
jgi:PIN domain nuclease of toxin-antitoxin system